MELLLSVLAAEGQSKLDAQGPSLELVSSALPAEEQELSAAERSVMAAAVGRARLQCDGCDRR